MASQPIPSKGTAPTAEIILDQTPFYAESGGQVGDTGTLTSPDGVARVIDTYSPVRGVIVHKVEMEFGKLSIGDEVQAQVDEERRRRIAANHTGTHILHAVLRETLGTHVKQAGSLVAPDRLRFDYTHFAPLTDREIEEIEQKINQVVFQKSAGPDPGHGDQRSHRRRRTRILWREISAAGSRRFDSGRQHGTVRRHAYQR